MMMRVSQKYSLPKPKFKAYKPKGKNTEQLLQNILRDASVIIDRFEKVKNRHEKFLHDYKRQYFRGAVGESDNEWDSVEIIKYLFELAEPENFDFDFHELRREFLDSIEAKKIIDSGNMFVSVCGVAGIGPIMKVMITAEMDFDLLYNVSPDRREAPELDLFIFESLEFDTKIIKLYIDAGGFYGNQDFLYVLGYA